MTHAIPVAVRASSMPKWIQDGQLLAKATVRLDECGQPLF